MTGHKLSVIIPCYNEQASIGNVLLQLNAIAPDLNMPMEVVIVNDGSTDETSQVVQRLIEQATIDVCQIVNEKNKGKGFSIRTALEKVTGTIVIIQDADLEYDPADYKKMIPLIINNRADVVYGSRFSGGEPRRVLFFFHTIGNKLLTFVSNLFTQLNLTDMETGYKMFKTDLLKKLTLREDRFGFEPEVTAKISKIKDIRIYEVGIAYYGRTYNEGKKINWVDGLRSLYCILKYNLFH